MSKKVIILGTGGNCADILEMLDAINEENNKTLYECAGFLDDDEKKRGEKFHGSDVLGGLADASDFAGCFFVNGIGSVNNFWKKPSIIAKTGIARERFLTLIHPTASVSKSAQIGGGTVVFQNVTITSNVKIGEQVVILPNSIVSHDCIIGDYTCIAGGVCISGGVEIGACCYLGTNAAIRGDLKIGDGSLIGMGSVVLENVAENTVVAGNPARFLRKVE